MSQLPAGPASTRDTVSVTLQPAKSVFFLGADATMPKIRAVCNAAAEEGQRFLWTVTLVMDPVGIPHAKNRVTTHIPIQRSTQWPLLDVPFTQVRGGRLTIKVQTTLGGKPVSGSATATILGTNPSTVGLRSQSVPELLLKLMKHESQLRQFLASGKASGYPLFSQDNLGGVGLGQITKPRPTDDEVWDWKANVRASQRLFEEKRATAKRILNAYDKSHDFLSKVEAYRQYQETGVARGDATAQAVAVGAKSATTPMTITLPAVTDEMVENETLRLYNGEPLRIHEYEAEVDAKGLLVVDVVPRSNRGTARWHQVTALERIARYRAADLDQKRWGDPEYVRNVRKEVVL